MSNPKALLSLLIIYMSVFTGWYWLWGVLLLLWAFQELSSGQVWLSETVFKSVNPVLYYVIVTTWVALGFYLVLSPLVSWI